MWQAQLEPALWMTVNAVTKAPKADSGEVKKPVKTAGPSSRRNGRLLATGVLEGHRQEHRNR